MLVCPLNLRTKVSKMRPSYHAAKKYATRTLIVIFENTLVKLIIS